MIFPFSLEGAARIWLEKEPPRSILTWDDLVTKFINQFFPPSKTTNLRNEITRFQQRFDESFYEAWDRFNDLLRACPHHGFSELHQLDTFYNALNLNDQDSLNSAAVVAKVSTSSSTPAISFDVVELKDMVRALLLDKKTNPYYVKANDAVLRNMQNQGQNLQIQMANLTNMLSKFVSSNTASSSGSGTLPSNTNTNPKEDLKGITTRSGVAYQGPTIPTLSKVVKQGTEMNTASPSSSGTLPSNIVSNPKSDLKSITTRSGVSYDRPSISPPVVENAPEATKDTMILTNNGNTKDVQPQAVSSKPPVSTSEPANTPVSASKPNLQASIPYPSRRNDERNREKAKDQIEKFYQLFKDKELALPELTPTCMTLELADRSVSKPIGIAKDVSVKAGIPTPSDDPIVSTTSPTLTPFGDSDFLLFEEANTFLGLEDDLDSPELDPSYYDPKRDIQMLEAILNNDPTPSLPDHEQSVPSFTNELKACEAKTIKSSVDEPPEVKLKDLPPHLEYAFLEGDNKLPVIIAKELGDEEIRDELILRSTTSLKKRLKNFLTLD
nr:reverse transcriptase domain-containing protein [Tanacetum cinerariifolium]